jgi:putative addiction module component (TIGR02574 family)
MTIAEISKMSVVERLQTMEALWDSLTHESTEIKSPAWYDDVLSQRKEKIENGDAKFISLEELKSKNDK